MSQTGKWVERMVERMELPWAESEAELRACLAICFPDTKWEDVPDEVKRKSIEEAQPIAAVYQDYLTHREQTRKTASAALLRSMEQSPGIPQGAVGERLYSIEEIRAMPAKEVRRRYGSLLTSLRHGTTKW